MGGFGKFFCDSRILRLGFGDCSALKLGFGEAQRRQIRQRMIGVGFAESGQFVHGLLGLSILGKKLCLHEQGAAARVQSSNNLKLILLAMHNYHDVYRHFPAAYGMKKDGTKLLSWRVYLLPQLDEFALYKEFHLDEPWDSEHNKKLIPRMPKFFASPSLPEELAKKGMASYVVPVGEKTIFEGSEATSFAKVTDGTSNTIGVLEADAEHAVIWTKPDDLKIDWKEAKKGLHFWKSGASSVFLAAFGDGSVHALSEKLDPATLKRLLQMNDGEPIGDY